LDELLGTKSFSMKSDAVCITGEAYAPATCICGSTADECAELRWVPTKFGGGDATDDLESDR
jgi:hypothetical protein